MNQYMAQQVHEMFLQIRLANPHKDKKGCPTTGWTLEEWAKEGGLGSQRYGDEVGTFKIDTDVWAPSKVAQKVIRKMIAGNILEPVPGDRTRFRPCPDFRKNLV